MKRTYATLLIVALGLGTTLPSYGQSGPSQVQAQQASSRKREECTCDSILAKIDSIVTKVRELIVQFKQIENSSTAIDLRLTKIESNGGGSGGPGEKGPAGEKGPQGIVGEQGPPGNPGPNGQPGKDGVNGVDGKTGLEGPPGRSGELHVVVSAAPEDMARLPIIYVTSKQWCDDCGTVTPTVEEVRSNSSRTIRIVELDGSFSSPPQSFKLTGLPLIHDFSNDRSYVGPAACLEFLSTVE